MKKILKPVYYIPAIILVILLIVWSLGRTVVSDGVMVMVPVQKGPFEAKVYSTGQLQAENATSIDVPSALSSRSLGIYEITVTDIIDEGTVVDSGDFVASLDHSAVEELMTLAREDLEKALENFEDAKIDTNINMSNLRDGLLNAQVTVEEKKLVLEQSIYESPAVKRQAQLDLERGERDLEQALRNYDLKQQQAKYDVSRAWEEVAKQQGRLNDIDVLFGTLEVKAPKPGMVIYSYDRFGNKISAGSTVSRWSPRIAELPDLTTMISKTYINEIDISRVKSGQTVMIGVDAFPEKSLTGRVLSVANIGQVLPNGDTKVFEVVIKVFGTDEELRPAMTTSNEITTDSFDEVAFIPLEAVFKNDSAKFVYTRNGKWVKQMVSLGAENSNYVVVRKGLEPGQEVALTVPDKAADLSFEGQDIYRELLEEAEKARLESESKAEEPKKEPINDRKKPEERGAEGRRIRGDQPEGGRR
jgi:hypothetical protein